MRGMKAWGWAAVGLAVGLGLLAAGCTRQEAAERAMTTSAPIPDTGSMQIPDVAMGTLRQGPPGPGAFQAAPAGPDTGSMRIPEHSMGNLRGPGTTR